MRIAIYSHRSPMASALSVALSAMGHAVARRNATWWAGEREPVDLLIVKGARRLPALRDAYPEIPLVVFDWGYLDRVNSPDEHLTGHWQVGVGALNAVPTLRCPPDRFNALGIDIVEQGFDPDGYVLLVGQMPGDAALMGTDHRRWLESKVAEYGAENVLYRPHPRGGVDLPGVRRGSGTLAGAIAGARLVVTFNSNTGHEALLAGVPVVCDGPAAYRELAGPNLPSVEMRKRYFHRSAYAQWRVSEAAQCCQFLLDHLLPQHAQGDVGADAPQPKMESSMKLIYTTRRAGPKAGSGYRNPRYFAGVERAASHVTVEGEWPNIVGAYRDAGIEVDGTGAPAQDPEVLVGSSYHESTYEIGGETIQLGDLVEVAIEESGLTTQEWNELDEGDRDARIQAVLERAQSEAAGNQGGDDGGSEQDGTGDVEPAITASATEPGDTDERTDLAAEYEARFGKKPHPAMKVKTLREKLAEE